MGGWGESPNLGVNDMDPEDDPLKNLRHPSASWSLTSRPEVRIWQGNNTLSKDRYA